MASSGYTSRNPGPGPRTPVTGRPNSQGPAGQGGTFRRPGATPLPIRIAAGPDVLPPPITVNPPIEPAPVLPPLASSPPTTGAVQAPAGSFAEATPVGVPLTMNDRLDAAAPAAGAASAMPSWLPLAAAVFVAFMILRK